MAHVQAAQITHSFGQRDVLQSVTLPIGSGARIALSGDNGSGKTTLLKIIAGLAVADSGTVVSQKNAIISYLPQSGVVHSGLPLVEECELAFARFADLSAEKEEIEHRLALLKEGDPSIETYLHRHHEIDETLLEAGFDRRGEQIQRVLHGLGFSEEDLRRDTVEFSGGWQMRIALAKVLLEKPDVLLLDEPTNYLDIEARNWLEQFLATFRGGVVIVSHDRYFLDVTVTEVAELYNSRLRIFAGNYTSYQKRRGEELKTVVAAYQKQQDEIAKLEDFIRRFRYNASKASQVQSRVTQLQKIDVIEIPESLKRMHFAFPKSPHSGKIVLRATDLSRSYGSLKALDTVSFQLERGEKLVIAGANGAGKSTLMRILSGRDAEYDGELKLGAEVKPGYFSQEIDELDGGLSVIEEAELSAPTHLIPTLRNLLGAFLFRGDDIYKRVSVLSGGERNRLALLKLLLNPVNLLILDEPTNHLDMASKQVLLEALKSFDGTLVFVSHDRYFIEELANRVLELKEGSCTLFPGDYSYYLWKSTTEEDQVKPISNVDSISSGVGRTQHKEQKKAKGEARRLERLEHELMDRIEALETEHTGIMESLADPDVYSDGEKTRGLKEELSQNELEQSKLSEEWHELEEKKAALNSNNMSPHSTLG